MKRWFLLLAVAAVGCGPRVKEVRSPDGRTGYSLNCRDPGQCHERAGELCPRGYDVHDAHERVEANPFGGMSKQTTDDYQMRQTMLIACKGES